MTAFLNFIKVNWQFFAVVFIDIISLVLWMIKRRVKVVDSPYALTIDKLASWINIAESLFLDGKDKKAFVLDAALNCYKSLGGKKDISSLLSIAIENILTTPTKKKGD